MGLYKICRALDLAAQEWRTYCLWRKREFAVFDSLDSSLRNSMFEIVDDDDWNYVVTHGGYVTDVVNDSTFAHHYAQRCGADQILVFDFADNGEACGRILGYDILDGALQYSLLTNFGNDNVMVNNRLAHNGLIERRADAITVHDWFLANMPDDPHVVASRVLTVYQPHNLITVM